MKNIPAEICYIVCSFLDVTDILHFRLVSKLFADIGAAYMLPDVSFNLHRDDLNRLSAISLHPILSKHVESLTYFAEAIDLPKVSWIEFVQNHQSKMRWNGMLRRQNNKTPSQLASEYKRYSEAVDEQQNLIKGEWDLRVLKEVLPRFPNLKTLHMSTTEPFYEMCNHGQMKRPLSEFLRKGYVGSAHPEGKRTLDTLLLANAHAPCAITALHITMVYWKFFKRSERKLSRLFKPFANLTTIRLTISIEPQDERLLHDGLSLGRCQRVFAKGALRKILRCMPQLRLLHLEIRNFEYEQPERGAQLHDIIEPGFHWPDLEEIILCGIAGDRVEFMDLFLRHKDKLRTLRLSDVTLASTSWRKLLPDIRNRLHLDTVCICGNIYGIREDEDDPPGPLEGMPGLEVWSLSPSDMDVDEMRDSIHMYCRQGGTNYPDELPLCGTVVNKYYKDYVKPFTVGENGQDFDDDDFHICDGLRFGIWGENDELWEDISDEEIDDDDVGATDDELMAQHTMEHIIFDMMMEEMLGMPEYYDDDAGMNALGAPLPFLDPFTFDSEVPNVESDDEVPDLVSFDF
ncbi:hypothetical protein F5B22DRAFT_634173 [Xylaria bambusicola]|uniref:uncharacterized protein n=1 Tax=Xylaria bambusicola TaxID=326684 RepID=UPI002008B93C|nr:uncharacterized protein F5B22DRAFT_634173 [Xylaria bambusicola]KAI0522282.1 hypothetical protein F5B22DRAFT_634173 [Xylaria bambusicola]